MEHALLDTNVIIHYLASNPKFYASASEIFTMGLRRKVNLYVTTLTYSNTFYVLRRFNSRQKVIKKLQALSTWATTISASSQSVQLALFSEFKDFEDALQNYTAESHAFVDTLVTNNIKDFKHSQLKVYTADQYAQFLKKL